DCAPDQEIHRMSNALYDRLAVSRRQILAGAGGAAFAIGGAGRADAAGRRTGTGRPHQSAPTAPFESLRDYLAAMERHGLLARFRDVDQDAWEATAIMYHLTDWFGLYGAPVVL